MISVSYEGLRTFEDERRYRRPNDDADAGISEHIDEFSADDGRRDRGNAQNSDEDIDGFPERAELGPAVLADGVEPRPADAFAAVAHRAYRQEEARVVAHARPDSLFICGHVMGMPGGVFGLAGWR